MERSKNKTVVIIGASHAGVNAAFMLRKEGWQGSIHVFDADRSLPYHRPPLSKTFLTMAYSSNEYALKPLESYEKEDIQLHLGLRVTKINRTAKHIQYGADGLQPYDALILATGARSLIPPIMGLESATRLFTLRTLKDTLRIKEAVENSATKKVVVMGGGFIGLETAASLKKMGAEVTVLERENRVLARVTSPIISGFFTKLHATNGVTIETNKNVVGIAMENDEHLVTCDDESTYTAAIIILGCGIVVNTALAEDCGLHIENGIKVDPACTTNDDAIYAIGDCTFHYNPHYARFVRLESVQNAVDQAKVAAAAICGKGATYDSIPWFWSDQYDIKLQMVGLSNGYDDCVLRFEEGKQNVLSIWYFKNGMLLAVDAINCAKAYVIGTKCIKNKLRLNKSKLNDSSLPLKLQDIIQM
ncbi:NAD(P)/FAD-dependent oxidoreductase [Maribacter chungangensis]|uniref:NAD(P)/FAD-dependent oxidoreductase n=1 Tax=Maribacter chungangensis TaxID=1069117 RepID=A0ABW3AYG8_9FLAO